ncbi:DNA gyrase inhibitor YacG [Immundisolibacter sp.]|uniref:DNA gyrase inhibitor YacG n=1 Tax=Immundisolibacter sp. TaxID=1934948 RepID=UPI00345AFD47
MNLPCPTCQRPAVWSPENPYRPFCSERCKLADLGSWLNGDYRLPVSDADRGPPADDE